MSRILIRVAYFIVFGIINEWIIKRFYILHAHFNSGQLISIVAVRRGKAGYEWKDVGESLGLNE